MDEDTKRPTRRNLYGGFCRRGSQRHHDGHQLSTIPEGHNDSTSALSIFYGAASNQASSSDQRVSDVERDAVIRELSEHFEAGRLDLAEFKERSEHAIRSRTLRNLSEVLTDLPSLAKASVERRDRFRVRPGMFVAIVIVGVFAVTVSNFATGFHHPFWFPWFLIPLAFFVTWRFRWSRW